MVASPGNPARARAPYLWRRGLSSGAVLHDQGVTTTLGSDVVTDPAARPPVPAATRATQPGWRDPRLWVGVLLVAASVLAGVRLVGGSDHYVEVWAVVSPHAAGDSVTEDDLAVRQVRFAQDGEQDRYLLVEEALPADLTLVRDVGARELLPRAALGDGSVAGVLAVPVVIPALRVPPGLAPGDRVDVFVSDPDGRGPAEVVLGDVAVLSLPRARSEFGARDERQVVLAVPDDDAADLGAALGALADGTVTVVRRG